LGRTVFEEGGRNEQAALAFRETPERGSGDATRSEVEMSARATAIPDGRQSSRYGSSERGSTLPPAVGGEAERLATGVGELCMYSATQARGRPLLLVHSINAAASAYEVRPLYEHYARERPTYALELPGFGRSERADRTYTPQVMAAAISAALEHILARHPGSPPDGVALSLSSQFLAEVAVARPEALRSVALISPTGFDKRLSGNGPEGGNRGNASVLGGLKFGLWRKTIFNALVSKPSMRFFLEKTWGGKNIDEGLFDYCQKTAHQPGAEYAPLSFVAGFLFPTDATLVYTRLKQPVWIGHGVRGDFVDFERLPDIARGKSNWTTHIFQTGALPHFERLDEVVGQLDRFFDLQDGA
jgi:pimeloyl-ACP methyl ester carboxylesterase